MRDRLNESATLNLRSTFNHTVADELSLPTEQISIEMLFRGLYHFTRALNHGKATDPVSYFTAPENKDLGIVKRLPKAKQNQRLDLSPHPT